MQDRARAGFALMVVIAVVLGILIGMRNMGMKEDEGMFSMGAFGSVKTETEPVIEPPTENGGDVLDSLRLERSKTRSRNIEALQKVAEDSSLSHEARTAAGMQLVDLSKKTEAEAEAEALIKARGYEDALVFVRGDGCDVIISGKVLSALDAEQIGDIAARCLGLDLANITIVEQMGRK